MSRNNDSHFAQNPTLSMNRSGMNINHRHKTTFNAGDLVPIYVNSDILPGDTVTMDMGSVVRMSTPIHPVMDDAFIEYFWFFVPHRLVWKNFEHFITGGLDAGEWDAPTVYEPPTVRPRCILADGTSVHRGFPFKSLADHMGIPCGEVVDQWNVKQGIFPDPVNGVSALPFRAYAKIWNDWFRASSIQKEILIPMTDGMHSIGIGKMVNDVFMVGTGNPSSCVYGDMLLKVNKYHDFFTSALLEPQRGQPVGVPLEGAVPVTTGDFFANQNIYTDGQGYTMTFKSVDGPLGTVNQNDDISVQLNPDGSIGRYDPYNAGQGLAPANLVVNADGISSLQISINDLRHAAAVQHILEIDARSGSGRYIDLLKGHFGVTSPDARLQRSEYLGGTSVPVSMDPVVQTSSTDGTSPQGNTAAVSWTSDRNSCFTKSFVEHGTLMCLATVRHKHSYQQGLHKMWTRRSRYDYYWPSLANISEQAILNQEIFLSGSETDEEVFGYQEAFAEYRYHPDSVSGAFRSNYPQSLDIWHYADYYTSLPHLSDKWLQEGMSEIDRTLAVSSSVEDQFIGDFAFKANFYRVMPLYSIPGLDRI